MSLPELLLRIVLATDPGLLNPEIRSVQRGIDTLLAVYLRAGRSDDAKALIARRTERRPTVPVAGLSKH